MQMTIDAKLDICCRLEFNSNLKDGDNERGVIAAERR